jgi:hypothetical protein
LCIVLFVLVSSFSCCESLFWSASFHKAWALYNPVENKLKWLDNKNVFFFHRDIIHFWQSRHSDFLLRVPSSLLILKYPIGAFPVHSPSLTLSHQLLRLYIIPKLSYILFCYEYSYIPSHQFSRIWILIYSKIFSNKKISTTFPFFLRSSNMLHFPYNLFASLSIVSTKRATHSFESSISLMIFSNFFLVSFVEDSENSWIVYLEIIFLKHNSCILWYLGRYRKSIIFLFFQ